MLEKPSSELFVGSSYSRTVLFAFYLQPYISNQCCRNRAPESDPFFKFCHCLHQSCPLDPDASIHFIHRFLRTAKYNEKLCSWLIEGDIARLLDSTEIRLISRGTRIGDVDMRDSVDPRYITQGPTYRALVLSLAWKLFQSPVYDERAQNSANAAELRFPSDHHDDWIDNQTSIPVFQSMRQAHKDRVYSWIDSL